MNPTPSPSPSSVAVSIVTYGGGDGSVYATAIIPELVENGGTCTLRARQGEETTTVTIPAVSTISATNCGIMRTPVGAGEWSLTVSYDSVTAHGTSSEQMVTIP